MKLCEEIDGASSHVRGFQPRDKAAARDLSALPEVFEKEAWGECTFRVTGGSMFAMTDNNHHNSGHIAVWIKAPPMVQEILTGSEPARFFKPPCIGTKGWVGVRLDAEVDWEEVAAILRDGYLMSAPKKARGKIPSKLRDSAASTDLTPKRISMTARRNKAPRQVR